MRGYCRQIGKHIGKHTWRRRIIALVAAYAVALSSLIASFGVARAAADAAYNPGGIICHSAPGGGRPSPFGDGTNNKLCANCCNVGCMMLMAALPPPPATAAAMPQAASEILRPSAFALRAAAPQTKAHRSRAPPLTA